MSLFVSLGIWSEARGRIFRGCLCLCAFVVLSVFVYIFLTKYVCLFECLCALLSLYERVFVSVSSCLCIFFVSVFLSVYICLCLFFSVCVCVHACMMRSRLPMRVKICPAPSLVAFQFVSTYGRVEGEGGPGSVFQVTTTDRQRGRQRATAEARRRP